MAGPQALGSAGSHAKHTQLLPRRAHTPPRTTSFGFHGARQEQPRDNVPPSCPCLGSQLRKPTQIQPDAWTKREPGQEYPGHQATTLTLGKCFMTHITTGCKDGIFTREKLFSRRSSSFLYLERLARLRKLHRTQSEAAACLSPDRRWLNKQVSTGKTLGEEAPFSGRDVWPREQ